MKCYLCGVETDKSYNLRLVVTVRKFGSIGILREVCPECHHTFVYGTAEQKENYKKRRNIIK